MVVPGDMFKVINNTERVEDKEYEYTDENGKKCKGTKKVVKEKYKPRDEYKGDLYGFSFITHHIKSVIRILECGTGVKNANSPLWANMAANQLENGTITFWIYKENK